MSIINNNGKGNLLISYLFKNKDFVKQINEEKELKKEIAILLDSKNYKFIIADDELIDEKYIKDKNIISEKELVETALKYRNMLEKLQFVQNSGMIGGAIYKFCPICNEANINGHKKDCELAKLLE